MAHIGPAGLPTGTVTFLFTDIEGSTRLLQELGSERYGAELELHRERVRRAVAAHGGFELGTEGDAFSIAFARASDALGAAGDAQAALSDGPIRVRIGIHTGEPLIVAGNYVGLDVHKAARICAAGHGGQVLVSQATRDLVGGGLRDLGEFRLKDLTASERLCQLGSGEFPPPRTLRPTNLPVQPGPLLGRREELAELLGLAAANRLLTLTGPGGSGKTRLALALAGELSDRYRDGAWWVPLAAVTDAELVLATIAQSLGAHGELREHLAGKRVLLLLDNLEQVLEAARLIGDLLGGLPDLSVIATSRERLAISLEQEYPVPPLDDAGAAELFISRARQLVPDFEPDETVGEICRRLDRLPLALELASTRIKLMSTSQMLDRIKIRLDLLSKGRRDAPDRQATMRATIGWSYDLLPASEQALFRGLGVFVGSFELEAAEGVCGADLDDLQSLIDKSLLRSDARGRFRLLELTREYALEQLDRTGEEAGLRRREADWFLQLAKHANEHLASAEQGRWLARLDADTDNLRAVLAWCSEHDPAGAIELASTLYWEWRMEGQLPGLSSWLERALSTPATLDAHTRATGLKTLGAALNFRDEYDRAREPLEQSLVLFQELGDAAGEASVLTLLGMQFANQGSLARGIELYEAALVVARGAGDTRHVARALNFLGGCFLLTGELERSRTTLEEALEIHTKLRDRYSMAADLDSLAVAALSEGDAELAARHYRSSLDVTSAYHSERDELYAVAGMACVAALRGDVHSAGRLWGVVEAAENRREIHMVAAERALLERIVTPLQGDQAFKASYATGRDVELAEAVRELRELSESD
jgi:predicted ATPase/class 3 adenylate cyclase